MPSTSARHFESDVDRIWPLVGERDGLGAWLDEPVDLSLEEGSEGWIGDRWARVTGRRPGERLSWIWVGADGEPSEVAIELRPEEAGTTVTVVERPVPSRPVVGDRPMALAR